jgi:hypothetical protein
MTDEKKKLIQMTIIIAGFALAFTISAISFDWFGGGGGRGNAGPQWLICINEDCGAQYEVSAKELQKMLQESNPMGMMPGPMAGPPSLICRECDEQSAYIAEKCDECGEVYLPDYGAGDYVEIIRCPNCGYSRYEEMMEE